MPSGHELLQSFAPTVAGPWGFEDLLTPPVSCHLAADTRTWYHQSETPLTSATARIRRETTYTLPGCCVVLQTKTPRDPPASQKCETYALIYRPVQSIPHPDTHRNHEHVNRAVFRPFLGDILTEFLHDTLRTGTTP